MTSKEVCRDQGVGLCGVEASTPSPSWRPHEGQAEDIDDEQKVGKHLTLGVPQFNWAQFGLTESVVK